MPHLLITAMQLRAQLLALCPRSVQVIQGRVALAPCRFVQRTRSVELGPRPVALCERGVALRARRVALRLR